MRTPAFAASHNAASEPLCILPHPRFVLGTIRPVIGTGRQFVATIFVEVLASITSTSYFFVANRETPVQSVEVNVIVTAKELRSFWEFRGAVAHAVGIWLQDNSNPDLNDWSLQVGWAMRPAKGVVAS